MYNCTNFVRRCLVWRYESIESKFLCHSDWFEIVPHQLLVRIGRVVLEICSIQGIRGAREKWTWKFELRSYFSLGRHMFLYCVLKNSDERLFRVKFVHSRYSRFIVRFIFHFLWLIIWTCNVILDSYCGTGSGILISLDYLKLQWYFVFVCMCAEEGGGG